MISDVVKTIEKNNMFKFNDKVIVAVSGGPDSMCLLHILYSLKQKYGLDIVAAHLNHCLRGEEADLDEEYVKEFCYNYDIKFYSKRVDVHKISCEKNISCEMAGREVRYEFFESLRNELKAQKIAIAHNANDQAETVLMRIMRGTGLEGLIGIKPVRDEYYVRPLINSSRDEIERYCDDNILNPRLDKTNLENIFSRNKIRLELIPYIEKNFNKEIIKTLIRLSDTIRKDNEYLDNIACQKFKLYCHVKKEEVIIDNKAFDEQDAILSRIIKSSIIELTGSFYNYEKIHIYDIIKLHKQGTGKKNMLPNNIVVINNYGNIVLYKNYVSSERNIKEVLLDINDKNIITEIGINVSFNVIEIENLKKTKTDNLTKYFDCDKIEKDIIIRYRKTGDVFMPLGMKGNKKLNRLFIDLKIPKEERDDIPLICFGNDIAWVVGYRISEKFKIDISTKKILQIRIEREGLI